MEEAINRLEDTFEAWERWNPHNDSPASKLSEALGMAISALRDRANRTESDTVKACEYCDGSEKCLLVDDDIPFGSYNSIRPEDGKAFLDDADGFHIRIKFCPMCGRRLEDI